MTDTEKAALEKRIDELCAEVERLRQELAIREASEQEKYIDYLRHENVDWEDKYRSIVAENAKLQELVSDYSDCLDTALWLASDAGYPVMPARDKFLSLEKRKREMGIEVD